MWHYWQTWAIVAVIFSDYCKTLVVSKNSKIERWKERTRVEVFIFWPNWTKEIGSVLNINVISICVANKCSTLFQLDIWGGWVTSRQSRNLTSLFGTSNIFCLLVKICLFLKIKICLFSHFDKTTIVWREGTLRGKVQESWSNQYFQNEYDIYDLLFNMQWYFYLWFSKIILTLS